MAIPTAVNGQITDAVTQSNVNVLASAPAMALGSLYQAMASSMSLAAQNATYAQQQANTIGDSVIALCSEILTNGRSK
jgi:Killing trait